MQASNVYQPKDLGALFNQTPSQIMDTLERAGESSGAVGRTLLPRSSHLRNKKTGIVFPWSAMLAEQTDIMEPCDASGNTDPAAWESTVNPNEYTDDERDQLYWAARNSAMQHAAKINATFVQTKEGEIPKGIGSIPSDTTTLDSYYNKLNSDMAAIHNQLRNL